MARSHKVTVSRPARSAANVYAKPPTSPLNTVVAIIGWVAAAVLVLGLFNSLSKQDRISKKLTADIAAAETAAEAELAAVKGSGAERQKELRQQATVLASDAETITKQKRQLSRGVATLERSIPRLERQAEQAVAATPSNPPATAPPRQFDPLGAPQPVGNPQRLPAPAPVAVATPAHPAPTSAAELDELTATRDALQRQYVERLELLKIKTRAVIADGRGPQIHAFYRQAAHTPYGAAALFFAAERYFQDGKLTQAAGAYRNLREQYPNSPYDDFVDERIDQVLDKDLYTRINAEIQAYTQ